MLYLVLIIVLIVLYIQCAKEIASDRLYPPYIIYLMSYLIYIPQRSRGMKSSLKRFGLLILSVLRLLIF